MPVADGLWNGSEQSVQLRRLDELAENLDPKAALAARELVLRPNGGVP